MSAVLVYDDTVPVPADVAAAIGINRFGELLYRKASLAARVRTQATAARVDRFLHLRTDSDVRDLAEQSRHWQGPVIYLPACLVPRAPDEFVTLLRKLRYADPSGLLVPDGSPGRVGLALLSPRQLRAFAAAGLAKGDPGFLADRTDRMVALPNHPQLVDLSEYRTFLEFTTSQFEARFFNRLAFDQATVEKRSADAAKMRREYAYYGLLPEAMQVYFLRPFDFREADGEASYKLERLYVPDMAVQWVHDAVTADEFGAFLDVVFRFLASRDRRPADGPTVAAAARRLYLDKLADRLAALERSPAYDTLSDLLRRCTPWGGLDQLAAAYRGLYERLPRPPHHNYLCAGHGDLCFSNILYDKRLRLMRLIDPRGADTRDELYTDPYYDVAKLSHSILGGYDAVAYDLFETEFDARLQLRLKRVGPDQRVKQDLFRRKLAEHQFDEQLVRLYEASLFLSMLPLHLENQRKLLGFVLTAADICGQLGGAGARRSAA